MYETPNAREQFARDVMLVLENDRNSYEHIMKEAKRLNGGEVAIPRLAEFIRDHVENEIRRALKQSPSDWNASAGTLLVAQLCYGWGFEPYCAMAQDFMNTVNESAGV